MKIEVFPSAGQVAKSGAARIAEEVSARPDVVLALPTGRTPIAMYEALVELRAAGTFDLGRATTFNLDEVLLPRASKATFFQFMTRHVWDPLGVSPERRLIPDGETQDPLRECLSYETAIASTGGLDLAILGIGADGHIAYNLPGQAGPRTHLVTLDPVTLASLGDGITGPVRAITMGVETILSARRIILLATGSSKAEALRRMKSDPRTPAWPCTLFRDHKDLIVIADERAAAQL